jgi:hypothetical protein
MSECIRDERMYCKMDARQSTCYGGSINICPFVARMSVSTVFQGSGGLTSSSFYNSCVRVRTNLQKRVWNVPARVDIRIVPTSHPAGSASRFTLAMEINLLAAQWLSLHRLSTHDCELWTSGMAIAQSQPHLINTNLRQISKPLIK